MNKKVFTMVFGIILICMSEYVFAHTPLCSCYENGDGTITCEGGFSNGISAAGVKMVVKDSKDNVLTEGKMDEDSEFTFKKPKGAYRVIFEAGEGHSLEVDSKEIEE